MPDACPNCHARTWNGFQGGFCTQCAYGMDDQLREKYGLADHKRKDSSENGNIVSGDKLDLSIQNLLLSQENQRLRVENERLSKAVGSGILGGLLSGDETTALVDFVKMLRAASVDGRRMAETAKTDLVPQGTTSAVRGVDTVDTPETPTPSSAQPGDA